MGACRTSAQDQDTLSLSLRSFFRTIPSSPFREKAYWTAYDAFAARDHPPVEDGVLRFDLKAERDIFFYLKHQLGWLGKEYAPSSWLLGNVYQKRQPLPRNAHRLPIAA